MRRPALRRFPREVIRRRQGAGVWNVYGEYEAGPIARVILPASIQPLSLEDNDLVGGSQLAERMRVFVPVGIERRLVAGEVVTFLGDVLLLNGSPVRFGASTGYLAGDSNPLAAAFDDRGADGVEIGTTTYTVEESQLWVGSHCRAILLRQI